jgi:hypothetical protein
MAQNQGWQLRGKNLLNTNAFTDPKQWSVNLLVQKKAGIHTDWLINNL